MTFADTAGVEDVLMDSHLLRSDGDARILPNIPYSEHSLIRNILEKSRGTLLCRRNIIVQSVPENTDPDYLDLIFESGNSSSSL